MSRTVDQIIREQLGSLLMEVAVLTAQRDGLTEENIRLNEELKKSVREPDDKNKE